MAYQIQIEIGGTWECGEWEETEAGERVEATHASEAEAQAELAEMFNEMEAQGMDFARDDWRVAEVEDADGCSQCGEPTDDGEGWNGLCGNCADAAEGTQL